MIDSFRPLTTLGVRGASTVAGAEGLRNGRWEGGMMPSQLKNLASMRTDDEGIFMASVWSVRFRAIELVAEITVSGFIEPVLEAAAGHSCRRGRGQPSLNDL